MIDMRNDLKDQKLVVYTFIKNGEVDFITAHSFIHKKADAETAIRLYFKEVNKIAEKDHVLENLQFVAIVGEYRITSMHKKEGTEDAKKNESQPN